MRPTILLFDIDGTLISSDGAGRRAMERAFEAHAGSREPLARFSFAGMTDRAIVRTGLASLGRAPTEREIDAVLADYLRALADEVAAAVNYRLHRGIAGALDFIDAHAHRARCAVGLGTGNVEGGARIKLGRVGICERFAFGGYGSDSEHRAALLRIGAERGASRLGCALAACRVVVIGDTPKDVDAAHAIGAEAIAVATGPYSVEALRACGPAWAFADLAEPGALDAILR